METAISVNQILEAISNLDLDDQEFLLQTLHKRRIEARRMEITLRAKEAEIALDQGDVKIGTVEDLWEDLND